MIRQVTLKNFQGHKKTVIDLHKGVNSIVGPSEQGKSSILRAVNWVIDNRPSGDEFRSHWGGDTEASLLVTVPDGFARITRRKTDKDNAYILELLDEDEEVLDRQEYRAFGQKVPEEVQTVINLQEINLQTQFEAPFLLSASAAEVARYFNRMVKLDEIDSSLSAVGKEYQSTKQSLAYEQQQQEELNLDLKKYEALPELEQQIIALEVMDKSLRNNVRQQVLLKKTMVSLVECQTRTEALAGLPDMVTAFVDLVEVFVKELKVVRKKADDLHSIKEDFEKYTTRLEGGKGVAPLAAMVSRLEKRVQQGKDLARKRRYLSDIVGRMGKVKRATELWTGEIEDLREKFDELMPDVCPLCGN